MPAIKKLKKRILIISPGIEDNGMRGLGVVTAALIDGLSTSGCEVLLLTGAPLKTLKAKLITTSKSASRRFIDHYLLEGYRSRAFNLNIKNIIKLIARDNIKLLFNSVEIIESKHIIDLRHEQSALRRFSKLSYFVNFAFIYKFSQRLPIKLRSWLIFSIARATMVDTIITASPFALTKQPFFIRRKIKVAQYVHDVMPLNILETPPDLVDKFSVELESAVLNSDKVMVSSYNAKQKLEVLFPNIKTEVVYLPCRRINESSTNLVNYNVNSKLKNNNYLLFMSAVEERKNVSRLIQAFALIAKKSGQSLVIVGSKGYGWEAINKVVNRLPLNIKNKIIFTGYISEEEKWGLISNCSAVVHPAIDEGLGIPVIESIIAGKPVLATRLNSLEEISPPNCVTFIEDPYDIHEIAEKLKIVISKRSTNNHALKIGSEIVRERFSLEKFTHRLMRILNT